MAKKIKKVYIVYMDNAETWEDWYYWVAAVFRNCSDAYSFLHGAGYQQTDRLKHDKRSIGNWWESIEPDEYSGNTSSAWIEEWEVM